MHPLMTRITELSGPEVANQIGIEFAAQALYIPMGHVCPIFAANLFAEFNGMNHGELARHYRISIATVYMAVKMVSHGEAASDSRAVPPGCLLANRQGAAMPEAPALKAACVHQHVLPPCAGHESAPDGGSIPPRHPKPPADSATPTPAP